MPVADSALHSAVAAVHFVAEGAADFVAAEAVDSAAAAVVDVAADAARTSRSSTTSCCWGIWRTVWVTTASPITAAPKPMSA